MSRTRTCLATARACRRIPTVVVLVLCVSGAIAPPAALAQSSAGGKDEADAVMACLERLASMAKEEIRRFDKEHPDPPALAARLGGDMTRIFEHVRDRIATEPYAGVLRGPDGALSSGSAGPVDKALLLVAMLESAGVSCRLVRGELDEAGAMTLVSRFLAADPLAGPLGQMLETNGAPDALDDFCRRSGLAREKIERFFDSSDREAAKLLDEARRQAADEAGYVQKQLSAAGRTVGQEAGAWARSLAGRVRDHVWVQALRPDGTWLDLDPSFPDAEPGKARGAEPKEVPPADLAWHRVELTLRLFRGDAAKPEEMDLLNVPIEASIAGRKGIDFSIVPADDLPPPSRVLEMSEPERLKLFRGVKRFQAIVRVGSETFASKVFDLDGNVMAVSSDGRIEGAQKVGGAVGGLFGGALAGSDAGGSDPPPSLFVSLEAVVGIERPGLPAQVSRRVLLTRDDLAGERALSPILEWSVLVQNRFLSAQAVERGNLEHQVAAIEPVLAAYRSVSSTSPVDSVAGRRPPPHSILLNQLAMVRQSALAMSVKAAENVAVMIDGPQVTVFERRFCLAPEGQGCSRGRIDLVNNSFTAVPRAGGDGPAAARLAMGQGVFDTVAESALLARASPGGTNLSAIVDLTAARTAGVPLEITLPASATGLSETERALASSQDKGRLILLPKAGTVRSWWSMDPLTGSIVGRSSGGAGQAFLENKIVQRLATYVLCMGGAMYSASKDTKQWRNLLKFEACTIALGFGVLGVHASPAVQGALHYISLALAGGMLYASAQ